MGKVYRKQTVEGVTVPAIIKNGTYYWHSMAVYEDGTVSCWKKVDLGDVQAVLDSKWLQFSVPDGQMLSVFELCCLKIISAKWRFDSKSYLNYIEDTVRSLDPEMANIYKTTQREHDKWEKYRVGFTADPTPCKLKGKQGNFGYDLLGGNNAHIFLDNGGELLLTELYAYNDGTFFVDGLSEEYLSFEEITRLFNDKTLRTAPENGGTVSFGALGEAEVEVVYKPVSVKQKLAELENKSLRVQNKPSAHERCIAAYHAYLVDPCDFYKEELRKAYEAVPEHERCYLGDMDTQDSDFRRILYTNDKREV